MSEKKLTVTQQTWAVDEKAKTKVFNTPLETGKSLDSHQGKFVLPVEFGGTCGLVSCVNVLRLAGREHTTEEEIVQFAIECNLCAASLDPDDNGGTNVLHRLAILRAFGLDSELVNPSIAALAQCVVEGRGVIITVDAGRLWRSSQYMGCLHAITVTSVKTDLEGHILGFYICDSGRGKDEDASRFIDVMHMHRCMVDAPMNVTRDIIR